MKTVQVDCKHFGCKGESYDIVFEMQIGDIDSKSTCRASCVYADLKLSESHAPCHYNSDIEFALSRLKLFYDASRYAVCTNFDGRDRKLLAFLETPDTESYIQGSFHSYLISMVIDVIHGRNPAKIISNGRTVLNILNNPIVLDIYPNCTVRLDPITDPDKFEKYYALHRDAYVLMYPQQEGDKNYLYIPEERRIIYDPQNTKIIYCQECFRESDRLKQYQKTPNGSFPGFCKYCRAFDR